MKKLIVLSAVLLGAVATTRAGVDVHIGLPLPPLPHIVIGRPAPPPVVVYSPPRVRCAPPPPVCYVPPPPRYCPPPRVVYVEPRYSRHGRYDRHDRYDRYDRHDGHHHRRHRD
jgi:hypothetical protein